jgi:glucose-1-phosphate cytidylyltransferase
MHLVDEGELNCYKHHGFWKCMDTLKDKNDLNKMWNENKAEWKLW